MYIILPYHGIATKIKQRIPCQGKQRLKNSLERMNRHQVNSNNPGRTIPTGPLVKHAKPAAI